MKLFFTSNCQHFVEYCDPALVGKKTVKKFSDGELYVKIDENVYNEPVWVIASTLPPAESIIELLFMLDALERCKAQINVLLVYCAYTRQDRAKPGEALSAQVFFNALKQVCINRCYIVHVHGQRIEQFYNFQNIIPDHFFYKAAQEADCIVAPDAGIQPLARAIADHLKKEIILVEKTRPEHEQVKLTSINGTASGKRVLIIDDIINTGNTLCNVATALEKQGATDIRAAVTHGIFAGNALTKIQQSPIRSCTVTNTIASGQPSSKISVINIWPELEKIIFSSE